MLEGLVVIQHPRQLSQTQVQGEIPGVPHGVLIGGGQGGVADGRAVARPHYPLGQEEVAEQAGDEQVLAEQLLE